MEHLGIHQEDGSPAWAALRIPQAEDRWWWRKGGETIMDDQVCGIFCRQLEKVVHIKKSHQKWEKAGLTEEALLTGAKVHRGLSITLLQDARCKLGQRTLRGTMNWVTSKTFTGKKLGGVFNPTNCSITSNVKRIYSYFHLLPFISLSKKWH